jgi:hypothetical protein
MLSGQTLARIVMHKNAPIHLYSSLFVNGFCAEDESGEPLVRNESEANLLTFISCADIGSGVLRFISRRSAGSSRPSHRRHKLQ